MWQMGCTFNSSDVVVVKPYGDIVVAVARASTCGQFWKEMWAYCRFQLVP